MPMGVYERTHPPWNKGLIKAEDPRLNYERPTKFKKGHKVNLGRHPSDRTLEKLRLANTGRKHSKETIEKRVAALRGVPRSETVRRKISETRKVRHASGEIVSWIKGKHLSREHKLKIGLANRGRVGALASSWRGGKTREKYTYEFNTMLKEKIRKRDKCFCAWCGKKGRAVHHIDYDKSNCNENNLITLCPPCHSKTNFNRKYWEGVFNDIIKTKRVS